MRAALLAIVCTLTLSACSKPADRAPAAAADEAAAPANAKAGQPAAPSFAAEQRAEAPPADAASAAAPSVTPPNPPGPSTPPVPAGVPMMAYSYTYGLEAQPSKVRALEARHEAACAAAGPTVCVVTGSSVHEEGKDRVAAQLSLRATPTWLAKFRAGLPRDADEAGGRILRADVGSEDLSRQIVDTEAALRAKTTLRDRLQEILATRPGKVSELLEVEQALAQTQGEIDATNSELAMMRQRVATSEVTLNYESVGVLAPQGVFAPLGRAVGGFLTMLVGSLSFMVSLIAVLLPWVLVIGALWWLFRKRLPKLSWPFGKKPPPPSPA